MPWRRPIPVRQWRSWACAWRPSNVEVPHRQRVLFNELPPRLDLLTHENGEHPVGLDRILVRDAQQRPRFGVHGGLPQLIGVHLPETLVALHHDVLLAETRDRLIAFLLVEAVDLLLATLDHE